MLAQYSCRRGMAMSILLFFGELIAVGGDHKYGGEPCHHIEYPGYADTTYKLQTNKKRNKKQSRNARAVFVMRRVYSWRCGLLLERNITIWNWFRKEYLQKEEGNYILNVVYELHTNRREGICYFKVSKLAGNLLIRAFLFADLDFSDYVENIFLECH